MNGMVEYPWESELIAQRTMTRREWYQFWSRYRLRRRVVRRGWEGGGITLREVYWAMFAMNSAFGTAASFADSLQSVMRLLVKPSYHVPYAVKVGADPLAPRDWFDRGLYRVLDRASRVGRRWSS